MIELLATLAFIQVNAYRVEQGLSVVPTSTITCKYAEKRLTDIKKQFSHKKFYDEVSERADGEWHENLGKFPITSRDLVWNTTKVVKEWKKSKTHRENLLSDMDSFCIATNGKRFVFIGFNQ